MIGQLNLLNQLTSLHSLPKCTLLVGEKGSEQLEVITQTAKHFDFIPIVITDLSVNNIRNIIHMSYIVKSKTLYIFVDSDDMSVSAKNALLKVMEEPPNSASFVLLLSDINNTLDTIQSRGTVFYSDTYTPTQIRDYYITKINHDKSLCGVVCDICRTPGDVDFLCSYDIQAFYNYVETVVDNIAVVSGSNCFKIASKVNLKTDSDKYDLRLFWNTFVLICQHRMITDVAYTNGILITLKALRELRNKSVNKQMLFDIWILDIRKEWRV